MHVKVFHRLGFEGMISGYQPGDLMLLVFEFDMEPSPSALENIFEMFNISNTATARAYRALSLRSLSVGDVVTFDDAESYAVDRVGWTQLDEPMLASHPLSEQAEEATRLVPDTILIELEGCRVVDGRVLPPDGCTEPEYRRIVNVWARLDTAWRASLNGLRIGRFGELAAG